MKNLNLQKKPKLKQIFKNTETSSGVFGYKQRFDAFLKQKNKKTLSSPKK